MYSEKVISQNLARLDPSVIWTEKGQEKLIRFQLQETPPETVEQFIDFFNDKIDYDLYMKTVDKGAGKTKIEFKNNWKPSLEHLIFIENERLMCKYSWPYWSERYYKISNIENKFVQYHRNRAQKVWDNIDARLEEAGLPVKRGNWKARQQTSTTHSQGKVQHRIQFWSDVKAATASLDKSKTAIMAQMITDSFMRQPFWLRPQVVGMQTGEFYYYDNGSRLNLGAGTGKQIVTGTTPTVVHCSEVPYYLYPNDSIVQSLLPAAHDTPSAFIVLEGTANGRGPGNFWWELWQDCNKGLKTGDYEVYPIFVPNCARDDTYPTEAWMRQRASIFAKWRPKPETILYAEKVRNYIINNPDLRGEFGSAWRLSREKIFWYETMYQKHKEKGTLHIFLQEFPATPEEMFQSGSGGIYSIELINRYESIAQTKQPDIYKVKASIDIVQEELQLQADDEIDFDKPRIIIPCNWLGDSSGVEFELWPIKFRGWDRLEAKNKLLIFEHPDISHEYGVSYDPSDGLGEKVSNESAVEVIRKGTIESNDKQVCEFTSPEISPVQMWPFTMLIGTYYSHREQCLMTIEINKGGEETQNAMMRRGWWNLFLRKDDTIVMNNPSASRRFGFYTSVRSREAIISYMNAYLRGGWIDLYSIRAIDELKGIKRIRLMSNRMKEAGENDNRFIALGMGLYALHKDEDREKPIWEKRAQQNASRIIIPTAESYFNAYGGGSSYPNRDITDVGDYQHVEDMSGYHENWDGEWIMNEWEDF